MEASKKRSDNCNIFNRQLSDRSNRECHSKLCPFSNRAETLRPIRTIKRCSRCICTRFTSLGTRTKKECAPSGPISPCSPELYGHFRDATSRFRSPRMILSNYFLTDRTGSRVSARSTIERLYRRGDSMVKNFSFLASGSARRPCPDRRTSEHEHRRTAPVIISHSRRMFLRFR